VRQSFATLKSWCLIKTRRGGKGRWDKKYSGISREKRKRALQRKEQIRRGNGNGGSSRLGVAFGVSLRGGFDDGPGRGKKRRPFKGGMNFYGVNPAGEYYSGSGTCSVSRQKEGKKNHQPWAKGEVRVKRSDEGFLLIAFFHRGWFMSGYLRWRSG